MCMKATCNKCEKVSWYGCGNHVPGVMDSIVPAERCSCEPQIEREGKKYPPKAESQGFVAMVKGMFGGSAAAKKEGGKDEI